jgi:hypothetical protein
VDAQDGKLTAIGQEPTEKTPRSFDLDPGGKFLRTAGEASSKLAVYRIDGCGILKRVRTYDVGKQHWWVMVVELRCAGRARSWACGLCDTDTGVAQKSAGLHGVQLF